MDRRKFLKSVGYTGLGLSIPLVSSNVHSSLPKKYLIVIHADGGWDPTSICDPKGFNEAYADKSTLHGGSTNSVALNSSKRFGDVRWSAVPDGIADETTLMKLESQIDGFFTGHGNRMTVINGIDTATNSHDGGTRFIWSGMSGVGYPSLAAYFAAACAPSLPLSFLSNGGYDFTAGTVARTRASSAQFLEELADPNLTYGGKTFLHRDSSNDILNDALGLQLQNIEMQISQEMLPKRRQQLNRIFGVRSEEAELAGIVTPLQQARADVDESLLSQTSGSILFRRQCQVAASAFKANLAMGANLVFGGFDTHDNHDARSFSLTGELMEGVEYLIAMLEYFGIREQTTVVISSDFGRTPYYNVNAGKDHWPITSMMVLHGNDVVTGGRVFGATTSDFNSVKISPSSGLPDSDGLIIDPGRVSQELRKLLGVADHPLAELFPLPESNFNIFV